MQCLTSPSTVCGVLGVEQIGIGRGIGGDVKKEWGMHRDKPLPIVLSHAVTHGEHGDIP